MAAVTAVLIFDIKILLYFLAATSRRLVSWPKSSPHLPGKGVGMKIFLLFKLCGEFFRSFEFRLVCRHELSEQWSRNESFAGHPANRGLGLALRETNQAAPRNPA